MQSHSPSPSSLNSPLIKPRQCSPPVCNRHVLVVVLVLANCARPRTRTRTTTRMVDQIDTVQTRPAAGADVRRCRSISDFGFRILKNEPPPPRRVRLLRENRFLNGRSTRRALRRGLKASVSSLKTARFAPRKKLRFAVDIFAGVFMLAYQVEKAGDWSGRRMKGRGAGRNENLIRVTARFFSGVPHPHLLGVCCPNRFLIHR